MKNGYKKTRKLVDGVEKGDKIRVGGMVCEVTKVEGVHYYTDDTTMRFELKWPGQTKPRQHATLFFPRGTKIEVLN